ncbi:MAG: class I SAM-dependent methyltransferase [Candidatus Altiarchaeales archaeon]|nr:class I SAM-dependent methyltransferase [Candidatus Altiarchaeales archaeon]
MRRFFRALDSLVDEAGPGRILDVGCGEGYVIKHLRERNNDLIIEGIDNSRKVLDKARELNPDVKFTQASIYSIPKNNDSFDLVLASEVLEHIKNPDPAIEELKRVSKKQVLITVPNEPFFRIANVIRLKYLLRAGNTPGHVHNWTRPAFRNLLGKHFNKTETISSNLWQLALCDIV